MLLLASTQSNLVVKASVKALIIQYHAKSCSLRLAIKLLRLLYGGHEKKPTHFGYNFQVTEFMSAKAVQSKPILFDGHFRKPSFHLSIAIPSSLL